jgi:hypothetical protein
MRSRDPKEPILVMANGKIATSNFNKQLFQRQDAVLTTDGLGSDCVWCLVAASRVHSPDGSAIAFYTMTTAYKLSLFYFFMSWSSLRYSSPPRRIHFSVQCLFNKFFFQFVSVRFQYSKLEL